MHIVIDIRTLQIASPDNEAFNHVIKSWLSAFLKIPYEHKVTLLIDPRFEMPVLDVSLSGPYWQPAPFESHPEISASPSQEAEQLASHNTNQFLLEQKADLFHFTNPFVSAMAVGYPPSVCRGVAMVYDLTGLPHLAEDGRLAATFDVKAQALRYCSRIVANSQSAANELMKWTHLPASRIDLIDDALSPQETALAIRQTYNKTLTSPFMMTSSGLVFPSDIPANDFGLSQLPILTTRSDVAEREYRVRSHMPVVGPLIADIRRKMTFHLREEYFDPIIEQQVSFNKKLVAALQSVCERVTNYEQMIKLGTSEKHLQHVHASQDIIDEATQKVKEHDVLNPYFLAGPLPEYGDCLGQHFYEQLYKATRISMPDVSDAQKQINQSIIVALHKLAQQAEAYYEQRQSLRHTQRLHQKLKRLTFRPIFDMIFSNEIDLPLQKNQMTSDKAYIGRLISWLQRQLTSHLQEPYIESILAKQVTFNRLAVMACSNVDLIHSISLKQLEAAAKITWHRSVRYSAKPIVGPILTWFQKNSMSHLQEPYLEPIFKRQEAFNCAYVEILGAINKKITAIQLKEHYERLIGKFEIKQGLKELKERNFAVVDEDGCFVEASAEQTEFIYQFLYLIEQMNSKVEVRL